jgi:CHAT domain-containing protein
MMQPKLSLNQAVIISCRITSLVCVSVTVLLTGLNAQLALSQTSETPAQPASLTEKIMAMERRLEKEYENYFGRNLAEVTQTPEAIAQTLSRLAQQTGTKSALLWVIPREDHLHLVLITPGGQPIVRDLYDVPRPVLLKTVQAFQGDMAQIGSPLNLAAAQQLHRWLIEPFESEYLEPQAIDTILFCMGDGVRGLPLAALHDGWQFLVEKYSLTRIPAFNLIKTDYVSLRPARILAMGASEFLQASSLPAVPVELSTIMQELQGAGNSQESWQGRLLLNQGFTLQNMKVHLALQSFDIVHLATHAEFSPGKPANSYIQFWDTKLTLEQMGWLNWNKEPELLVLSACQTAVGDREAELGFAGLALQSGVKSALASLWSVNDAGTLALMGEFYRQLTTASTKAEALRQAQIAMLYGEVHFKDNHLVLSEGDHLLLSGRVVPLPDNLNIKAENELSHPYYWAGFTMISSPW